MNRSLTLLALLALGCSQLVSAATYTVRVGWQSSYDALGPQWYSLWFYPHDLTIVYGDSVTWVFESYEPHNVVFSNGTLMSETQPNGHNLTAIAGVVGNQTHFVDPTALYSSGIRSELAPPSTLVFVPSTGSGTFNYYCSIHQGMDGNIIVLPAGSTAPLMPAQVDASVSAQIAGLIADADAQVAMIHASAPHIGPDVTHTIMPDGTVQWIVTGGQMSHSAVGMQMFARFLPSYLEIQQNDTVTWVMGGMDPHWVFFNQQQTFPPIFANFDPSQPLNASIAYVSPPYTLGIKWFANGAPSTVIPLQTWPNSDGLINSGLMFAPGGPPVFPHNISVKFTTLGTWVYSCPLHAELGMFGTVRVKPQGAALCANATVTSSCAIVSAAVRGDPQFTGLLGQSYQVHGMDGAVYNLITDTDIQVNAKFTFIDDSAVTQCPNKPWHHAGLSGQKIACWSHDGSYLSAIGMMDSTGNKLSIVAGAGQHGFAAVQFNGRELTSGSVIEGLLSVEVHSSHHLSVTLDEFTLHIENSDGFVNLASVAVDRMRWSSLSAHGLLGQTWHRVPANRRGSVKHIEGEVDDYLVTEDSLFGIDFVYNRFTSTA